MRSLLLELRSQLEDLTAPLPQVSVRRMFGCDAFLARGAIFALVWREGRIGLKLPDDALPVLRAMSGADPWRPRDMVVRQWVLVPESFHDAPNLLEPWVRQAHAAALERGPAAERRKPRQATARRPPRKGLASGSRPGKRLRGQSRRKV